MLDGSIRTAEITATGIGGEEFAVILPETPISDALTAATRLKTSVETTAFDVEGTTLSITVSIGVSMVSESTATIEAFMKLVDNALYEAKNNGRNRIEYL